jgi:hypothetical protein
MISTVEHDIFIQCSIFKVVLLMKMPIDNIHDNQYIHHPLFVLYVEEVQYRIFSQDSRRVVKRFLSTGRVAIGKSTEPATPEVAYPNC